MTIYRWQCGVSRIDIEGDEYSFFLEDERAVTDADMLTVFRTLVEDCWLNTSLFVEIVERREPNDRLSAEEYKKLMIGEWDAPTAPPEMADAVIDEQGREDWRCRYCDGRSRPSEWKKTGDACPKCGASPTFMGGL